MEETGGQSGSVHERLSLIEARLAALERLLAGDLPLARETPPPVAPSVVPSVPAPSDHAVSAVAPPSGVPIARVPVDGSASPPSPPSAPPFAWANQASAPIAREFAPAPIPPTDPWLGVPDASSGPVAPRVPDRPTLAEWTRSRPSVAHRARPTGTPARSIEQTLGLGGALWAGAGVLLLGVIFALVYAWDQGWLRPSPTARVIAAFSAGGLLHLAGWWVRVRRGFVSFAGVVHGLATAVIVLTSLAAYAAFPAAEAVLPVEGAIVGAWIGVVGALVVTYLWGLTTPGVVAVVAAMIWPAVLGSDMGSGEVRLVHIFVGALAAGAVSILRPGHAVLLGMSLPGVWLWIAGLVGTRVIESNGVVWIILGWAIIAVQAAWLDHVASRREDRLAARAAGALGMINGIFAWITGASLGDSLGQMQTLTAAVSGVLLIGHGGLALLTREMGTRIGHLMISMAMATVLPALLLDGFFISLSWLVMACLMAGGSWALDNQAMRRWSAALWGLVVVRLFAFDIESVAMSAPLTTIEGLTITKGLLLAFGVGVIGIVFAAIWRMRRIDPPTAVESTRPAPARLIEYGRTPAAIGLTVVGAPSVTLAGLGALVPILAVMLQTTALPLTAVMVLMGALVAIAGILTARPSLAAPAVLLAVMAGSKWIVGDVAIPIIESWRSPLVEVLPVLNPTIAVCVALGVLLIVLARWLRPHISDIWAGIVTMLALLVVVAISSESLRAVDRLMPAAAGRDVAMTHHVVLSVLWGVLGFLAIAIGFARRSATLRYAGLSLLVVTLMKVLLIDMAGVSAIWRILSFLTLGALLLGVSFIYHVQTQRSRTDPPAE